MVKGTAGSYSGGNSDSEVLCKQPSVQTTTRQVVGVDRVVPVYSSGSWMKKLDPNLRV